MGHVAVDRSLKRFATDSSMPLETLHTVLLGTVKYGSQSCPRHFARSGIAFSGNTFLPQLGSVLPPNPEESRYFRSHLGRELRYVAQGLPFMMVMIEERFPDRVWTVETWMVVAHICFIAKLLYRDSVPADTDNVLTFTVRGLMNLIVASQDEAIAALAVKPKFHLLLHADTFQTLFGPLKHSCATEREESRIGHTKSNIANSNGMRRHATWASVTPKSSSFATSLLADTILSTPNLYVQLTNHFTYQMADANEDFPDRGWEHWKAVTLSGKLVNAGASVVRKVEGEALPIFYMFYGVVQHSHDVDRCFAVVRPYNPRCPTRKTSSISALVHGTQYSHPSYALVTVSRITKRQSSSHLPS
ncbi:hypothetical protein BCR44DRAFT_1540230 [Catenaria anguillulae PL171]|uniref:Uncharacterized protein n=1 Tax=Catenaria anguillulae PL171 TaxID=765915 RepID=A0A1Y2H9U8_9FUNG|nr:hypothetical protein BCR44DRAFT_1540230 [Catenaria anguillulae PL171]